MKPDEIRQRELLRLKRIREAAKPRMNDFGEEGIPMFDGAKVMGMGAISTNNCIALPPFGPEDIDIGFVMKCRLVIPQSVGTHEIHYLNLFCDGDKWLRVTNVMTEGQANKFNPYVIAGRLHKDLIPKWQDRDRIREAIHSWVHRRFVDEI